MLNGFNGFMCRSCNFRESGFSLIEVLVTLVILAIGLLGLSGLQAKVSIMEMESYQRAQALSLVQDMEIRLRSSRGLLAGPLAPVASGGTAVTTTVGPDGDTGYTGTSNCATETGAELQVCQWAAAISGAAERIAGSKIGAMLGARGCIVSVSPSQLDALGEYYVVVVWQGLVATADPDAGTYAANCASDNDYGTGLRRAAVMRVLVPKLDA